MADRDRAHPAHDLELVARAAAGDLAASEAIAARDLLAACPDCTALATDLRALAAATRDLPDAAARSAHLRAPRDFRLSPADASRLRPRGLPGLGRRLAGLGLGGGFGIRFGGALVSLGLVGLLVSAGLPALLGGGGGAASLELASGVPDQASPPAIAPVATDAYALSTSGDGDRAARAPRDVLASPASPWATVTAGSIIVATAGLVLLLIGLQRGRSRPDGT